MRLFPRLLCAFLVLPCAPALAQPEPILTAEPPAWASLEHPLRLDVRRSPEGPPVQPTWTSDGRLLAAPPMGLWGLSRTAQSGVPVWDPGSKAWYASAEGCLVRVEPEGSLTVLLEGVQGTDLDVRANEGLAVSREPDDRIVLWRVGGGPKVLLSGPQYFAPRFSPDGKKILVSESRGKGGHMLLLDLEGREEDLGPGAFATWSPDGRSLVFVDVMHDGHSILWTTVHRLDLDSRREELLVRTEDPALIGPAISPDGRLVAFRAAQEDAVFVAWLPKAGEGR